MYFRYEQIIKLDYKEQRGGEGLGSEKEEKRTVLGGRANPSPYFIPTHFTSLYKVISDRLVKQR